MKFFKFLLVLSWGLFLCLNTFTDDLEELLSGERVGFVWNASPDYAAMLNMNDLTTIHPDFVIVKLGHLVGFGLFDLLVFWWLKRHVRSFFISVAFAIFTEIFQLYFGRDGRLYDIVIDSIGIILVFALLKRINRKKMSNTMAR
ncbi:hypothetical protein A374_18214 [Fictibacillus macauensis ZFHKF-1]|uniref:VanZ-like domain-containing protein n=1 Tax=Fictibacillus macauensis ZFHKF-1 TaxID=1196324 RepID=I8IX06_9BACL|nr:VanZ family protein [Fictibacillus macauensis]EIT83996.1 hypothetical protein A374_18214 [Fictibacillus macauensis ZFHKF-1]